MTRILQLASAARKARAAKDYRRTIRPLPVVVALVVTAVGGLLLSLLYLSARTVDGISFAREKSLVEFVVAQSVKEVSHNQESVTVWDDAILQLRKDTLDHQWLDNNLGIWLHAYFGLDEAYVMNPQGHVLYAMREGKRVSPIRPPGFDREVQPLIERLRAKQSAASPDPLHDGELSLGVTEVSTFAGRPAIVSIKPIISDTGDIKQVAGTEHLHFTVRWLDGAFLSRLARDYRFQGARFSWSDSHTDGEAAHPWRSPNGSTIGYFIWKPFEPGTGLMRQILPLMVGGFLLFVMITALLVRKVHVGTQQLVQSQQRAEHLAFHDTLTGLPNRAMFEERLQQALLAFTRDPSRNVALLYLDLDRFKKINDTLGHPAGDELIREFGLRMRALTRGSDTIARLGGDEFAIIQADVRSQAETESLCERLIETAAKPFSLPGSQAFVGISIGVAFAGQHGTDVRELARKADIALYEAKGSGRGCYTIFRDALDEPIQQREAIERELRQAIESEAQIAVHYQPFYSGTTGNITGVEALVRWDHPVHGSISPATFVPAAEESGLIQQVGDLVLRQACAAAARWDIPLLSVNVSPVQLSSPHFAFQVLEILAATGLNPARLELEITETALIANASDCQPNIRLLRMAGVKIALDDFGTGYSSLRHIADFEVDRVKIDRSFVHEIGGAASGDALVQAIVDLAQAVGLETTAEGVETEEQSAFLRRIGCKELQGFLLAPAMSAPEFEARFQIARRESDQVSPQAVQCADGNEMLIQKRVSG